MPTFGKVYLQNKIKRIYVQKKYVQKGQKKYEQEKVYTGISVCNRIYHSMRVRLIGRGFVRE
jgi:hypothetical protein